MKILILRQPQTPAGYPGGIAGGACYLTDMLFHGLRKKFGDDVVEHERSWWMYEGDFGPGKFDPDIYCPRGFTIYRTLGDDSSVDRTDIETKIKSQYYDYVIFGYTHYGLRPGSWDLVTKHYPKNRIAYIDGGDLWSDLKLQYVDQCVYFKREIHQLLLGLHPISFAMPTEKIGTVYREKVNALAPMNPHDKSSYIYNEERPYYQQYAESLFGVTTKKNGWDCVRHYEIMANNCIPLFLDIEQCPEHIMTTLPKEPITRALKLVQEKGFEYFATNAGEQAWLELNDEIQRHFRKHCTTEALADYFLTTMRSSV
jgi:hypothetical protein